MRIIKDDVTYIQKIDFMYLLLIERNGPYSIFDRTYLNEIIHISGDQFYDFISFQKKEEIDYLNQISWLIDYDYIKDVEEDSILLSCFLLFQKKVDFIQQYQDAKNEREQLKLFQAVCCLDSQINGLFDYVRFCRGDLDYDLPNGVEYPEEYKNNMHEYVKKHYDSLS